MSTNNNTRAAASTREARGTGARKITSADVKRGESVAPEVSAALTLAADTLRSIFRDMAHAETGALFAEAQAVNAADAAGMSHAAIVETANAERKAQRVDPRSPSYFSQVKAARQWLVAAGIPVEAEPFGEAFALARHSSSVIDAKGKAAAAKRIAKAPAEERAAMLAKLNDSLRAKRAKADAAKREAAKAAKAAAKGESGETGETAPAVETAPVPAGEAILAALAGLDWAALTDVEVVALGNALREAADTAASVLNGRAVSARPAKARAKAAA